MYIWECHKIGDLKTHWAVEVYMPFWTKEKGAGVWDFKKKAGRQHVNKFLLGHPETMRNRRI